MSKAYLLEGSSGGGFKSEAVYKRMEKAVAEVVTRDVRDVVFEEVFGGGPDVREDSEVFKAYAVDVKVTVKEQVEEFLDKLFAAVEKDAQHAEVEFEKEWNKAANAGMR